LTVRRTASRTGATRSRPQSRPPVRPRITPRPVAPPAEGSSKFRLPDGSRSVQSPWVWRGLFMMSLVALGLCVTLISGGHTTFALLWAVITAGWFAVSMWLWRQNVKYMG
jgi:hypothetical protein